MLPLPPFSLARPTDLNEALDLLASTPQARVIAGGTDLLPSMKYGLFEPPVLLSIGGLSALKGVHTSPEGGLSLGAGLSLRDIRRHPIVQAQYPALAAACATVATPTLQAMGTLGGNLLLDTRCVYYNQSSFWRGALGGCLKCETQEHSICHVAPKGKGCYAAHSADTVPVLMLLMAEVELASAQGIRRLPLSALYGDDGRTWLNKRPDELLTRVFLPAPSPGVLVHRKVRTRGAIDYPLLLVAALAQANGARVVVSAVGPRPVELQDLPALDLAQPELLAEAAAELAYRQIQPLPTHNQASTWRKRLVRVEVQRALVHAFSQLLADPARRT